MITLNVNMDNMYQKSTLENGIRVITESMPEMRSISMGVIVDASPRNETEGREGLAHLTEHAMFHGTSGRDVVEISRLIDSAGGQMGGFTSKDYTCYYATVLDDYRTYALDLLGDMLLNSIFPEKKLEMEKQTILQEIEIASDNPGKRVHSQLNAQAWRENVLGRSITGSIESVKYLTREDVIYFVAEHYLPTQMIIGAAGNVEHADFVSQVGDAFWRMIGADDSRKEVEPDFHSGVSIMDAPVNRSYFAVGVRAWPYANSNRYALHMLNTILGGGFSSRFFRKLREERALVYDIDSEYLAYRDDGILVIQGSTSPGYLMDTLEIILSGLSDLVTGKEPVNDEEVWLSKMQIRGQHLISSENTHTRMSRLLTQEFYFGRCIDTDEILQEIQRIDVGSIRRMIQKEFAERLSQTVVAVVGPEQWEKHTRTRLERNRSLPLEMAPA